VNRFDLYTFIAGACNQLGSHYDNYKFIPVGTTVHKEIYSDIIHHLRDAVRRKHSQKWRANNWFFLHNNASAHQSVMVKAYLAKNNVTTLEHPLCSPADFYLFPQPKSVFKGQCICNASDIINIVEEELERLSQNGFQKCFQNH
jgi:hypothetical protein